MWLKFISFDLWLGSLCYLLLLGWMKTLVFVLRNSVEIRCIGHEALLDPVSLPEGTKMGAIEPFGKPYKIVGLSMLRWTGEQTQKARHYHRRSSDSELNHLRLSKRGYKRFTRLRAWLWIASTVEARFNEVPRN